MSQTESTPEFARHFDEQDQVQFAELTGDWNPIHVDPVAARRTAAGAPVVHGIHLLLWALDRLAAAGTLTTPPARLHVSFSRFVLVGDEAVLRVKNGIAGRLQAGIFVAGGSRCEIRLDFGDMPPTTATVLGPRKAIAPGRTPLDPPPHTIGDMTGLVQPAQSTANFVDAFPAAAALLGAQRLAALGASTRLVGMVCPGLHSLFGGLGLALDDSSGQGAITFAMSAPRHGMIGARIAGSGVYGSLTCFQRPGPLAQRGTAELSAFVPSGIFSGAQVLVVGASRGLGELTAKLLAAGGADVSITWSRGQADALAVADDIRSAGRRCDVIRYQVEEPAALQLASLREAPTHVYYYATPLIGRPTSQFFDGARLAEFHRFFVDGFWSLATAVGALQPRARLFYPSTVYVERWPIGLAEYAMAKAAGEIMCEEINSRLGPLRVVSARLPRVATDQTTTIGGDEADDPIPVLLPLLRAVQRAED